MKERPILFNGDMVRAILSGEKTQTRRVVNPQPKTRRVDFEHGFLKESEMLGGCWHVSKKTTCPYGLPGDRLWVRETAAVVERMGADRKATIRYEADGAIATVEYPSRLAPIPCVGRKLANGTYREASRITLVIVDVRVERLQWIDDKNAGKEGIRFYKYSGPYCDSGKLIFKQLWNSIYKNWDENPWVWVVEFERVQQ